MITTDLAQMAEEDCGLCIFPDLQDNFKQIECKFNIVDRLSIATFGRIGLLSLLLFERCRHSKQLIYLSKNDILILLALF